MPRDAPPKPLASEGLRHLPLPLFAAPMGIGEAMLLAAAITCRVVAAAP